MRSDILPFWLRSLDAKFIIGFEDTDDENESEEDEDEEDEVEDEDEEDDEDDEKSKSKSKKKGGKARDDDDDEDNSGLVSALQKERRERKKLEKEAKALRKLKEEIEDKDKSKSEKATKAAEKAEGKTVKLAAKLQKNAVDTAILKAAGPMKFKDVDDAINLVTRSLIEVEQDEDDPSEIEIDEKSVERALKKLAKRKPHLVKGESDDEDDADEDNGDNQGNGRTGSKFNGKTKNKKAATEQEFRKKYPALGPARG